MGHSFDILTFFDFLLEPPQPFIGLFLTSLMAIVLKDFNFKEQSRFLSIKLKISEFNLIYVAIWVRMTLSAKKELNPLSSCQVIILIARMTFNCSTSCLMS